MSLRDGAEPAITDKPLVCPACVGFSVVESMGFRVEVTSDSARLSDSRR